MSEIKLNIHEAKTHLSRYLNEMTEEDRMLLCKRNRPVAEVRLVPRGKPPIARRLGAAKGQFEVTSAFFEPLADEVLDAFQGNT